MKLNKILLIAAIALGMVACKNSTDIPDVKPDEQAKTYVAFSIAMPSKSTRGEASDVGSANAGDTYKGTEAEQKVNKVRVVLYNENDLVAYSFDFSPNTPPSVHGSGDKVKKESEALYITDAKKVVKKDYQVLVLINPTPEVIAVTNVDQPLSTFETAVAATVEDLTTNGIFMSNAHGLAKVPVSALKETADAAQAAPFLDGGNGIKVDRAVAKVFVGGTATVVPDNSADFFTDGWTLDITNKKLFWMRKFAKVTTALNTFVPENKSNGTDRWGRYALDPNFDSNNRDVNEYNYLDVSATNNPGTGTAPDYYSMVYKDKLNSIAGFKDDEGKYVLENTMQPWCQYEEVTTRVIIKGTYTPKADGFTPGQSWYSFDNIRLTEATFQDYVTKVKAGDPLPAEAPTGIDQAIQDAIANSHDFDLDKTTNDSYIMTFKGTITGKKLKFYKDSKCYYAVKIRHFNDAQSSQKDYDFSKPNVDNGYGRYGVVRNNIYKLTLGKVRGPGEPVITPPDPDDPDDEEELWLSVKTEIMPWIVRTQVVDL